MAPTYSSDSLKLIASAVGLQTDNLTRFEETLEATALWYRLNKRSPRRITPSELKKRLTSISNHAKKLLKQLGIEEPLNAEDGPEGMSVLEALTSFKGPHEEAVLGAASHMARLIEIVRIAQAASDISNWADDAHERSVPVRKSTTPEGHTGDTASNEWIASMMQIYEALTGRPAVTSTASPTQKNSGEATGPLIRFLREAQVPIGLNLTADALAARVQTIRDHAPAQI